MLPEEATTSEQRAAYNNYVESVQPGAEILSRAEFAKLMKKRPEDFQFYLGEENL